MWQLKIGSLMCLVDFTLRHFYRAITEIFLLGRKWLDEVERELSESGVMISLVSPTSLTRPWVNIELGATWIKRVPIIPLCHSGQTIAALPRPFSDFNGVDLARDDAARRLMSGVADALQVVHPKGLDWNTCLMQMRAAASKSEVVQVVSAALNEMPASELPEEQIAVLRMLAEYGNRNSDAYVIGSAAPAMCGLKPMVFKYHAEQLSEGRSDNSRLLDGRSRRRLALHDLW